MSTAQLLMNPQSRLITSGDAVPPSYATSWLAVTEPTDREPVIEPINSSRKVFDLKEATLNYPAGRITQPFGTGVLVDEGTPWLQADETVQMGFNPNGVNSPSSDAEIAASAEFMANSYQTAVGDKIFQMGRVVGDSNLGTSIGAYLYTQYLGFGPLKIVMSDQTAALWWRGLVVSIITTDGGYLTRSIVANNEELTVANPNFIGSQWTTYDVYLTQVITGNSSPPIAPPFAPGFFRQQPANFSPSLFDPATKTRVAGKTIVYQELRGGDSKYPSYTALSRRAYGLSSTSAPPQPIPQYGPQTVATPDGKVFFLPIASDEIAWYDTKQPDLGLQYGQSSWWDALEQETFFQNVVKPVPITGAKTALPWKSGNGTQTRPLFLKFSGDIDKSAAYQGLLYASQQGAELFITDAAYSWNGSTESSFVIDFLNQQQVLELFSSDDEELGILETAVSEDYTLAAIVTIPVWGPKTLDTDYDLDDYLSMIGIFDAPYWPRRMKFNGGCYIKDNKIALTPLFGWLNSWFAALFIGKEDALSNVMDRFITIYDIPTDTWDLVLNNNMTDNVIYYNPIQTTIGESDNNGGLLLMQAAVMTDATYTLRSGFAKFNPYNTKVSGLGGRVLDRSAPYIAFAEPSPERAVSFGLQFPISAVVMDGSGNLIYAPYLSDANQLVWTILQPSNMKATQYTDATILTESWANEYIKLLSIALYDDYIVITCNRPQPVSNNADLEPMTPNQIMSFQSQDALFFDDGGVEAIQVFPLEFNQDETFLSGAPITIVGDYAVPSGVLLLADDFDREVEQPEYSMNNCVITLKKFLKIEQLEKIYGGSKGRTQKILPRTLPRFVRDRNTGREWLSSSNISSTATLSRPSDMVRCSRLENEDYRVPTVTDKSIFPCETPFFVPTTAEDTPEEAEKSIKKSLPTGFVVEGPRYLAVTPGTFGPGGGTKATVGGGRESGYKLGNSDDWPSNKERVVLRGSDQKQSVVNSTTSQIPIGPFGVTQPASSRILSSTVVANRNFLYAAPTNSEGSKKLTLSDVRRGLLGQGEAFGVLY